MRIQTTGVQGEPAEAHKSGVSMYETRLVDSHNYLLNLNQMHAIE